MVVTFMPVGAEGSNLEPPKTTITMLWIRRAARRF
jgi:hypothetical protein